jgi:hypothetical protein
MPKRSRNSKKLEDLERNVRVTIFEKKEIFHKYINESEEHNLVIRKVEEKLATDVLPEDIDHFKNILRNRYSKSFSILHECSDKIKNLEQKHVDIINKIADIKKTEK